MKNLIWQTLLLAAWAALPACNNSQASVPGSYKDPTPKVKSVAELRRELKAKEEVAPQTQLTASGNIQENKVLVQNAGFFHPAVYKDDGYIIHGLLHNSASLATFKDVVVQVTYYSETQTNLGSYNYVIYKYFGPNTNVPFDLNVNAPPVMRHFSLQVINASIP